MKKWVSILALLATLATFNSLFAFENFWTHTNLKGVFVSKITVGRDGLLYAGTSDGLYRSRDKGYRWEKMIDLQRTILCITQSVKGTLFIGTNDGLFRLNDETDILEQIDSGLKSNWIISLAATEEGVVYAGAYFDGGSETGGVYETTDEGATWVRIGLNDRNVNELALRYGKELLAATDFGIYEYISGIWHELAPQWTDSGRVANSLAFDDQGELHVGANDGIYYFNYNGTWWNRLKTTWSNENIRSIVFNSYNHLFAANSEGIYRTTDYGKSWIPVDTGLQDTTYVNSLAMGFDDFLFAATFNGIYRSTETTRPTVYLEIPWIRGYVNHEVHVPIWARFPYGFHFSSFNLKIDHQHQDKLKFIEILTDSSLLEASGWLLESYVDTSLNLAGAGSFDLGGKGPLCWLRFMVIDTIPTEIPLHFLHASFSENNDVYMEFEGGAVQIQKWCSGDVSEDGQVHPFDASLILKYLVGYQYLNHFQKELANVSGDTTISALDASLVLQYTVGMIPELPYISGPEFIQAQGNFNLVSRTVTTDTKVEIPVYAQDIENIFSFEAEFSYDQSRLMFDQIVYSEGMQQFFRDEFIADGKINIVGSSTQPFKRNGIIATLQFNIVDESDLMVTQVNFDKLRLNEGQVLQDVALAIISRETSVTKNSSQIPLRYELAQNYPNPFNPTTIIRYQLPEAGQVNLKIYNVTGQLVENLVNQHQEAGWHTISWDACHLLSAGLYFYEITANNFVKRKKCLLIK